MLRDASTPPARRTPRRQERMYTYTEARVPSPLLERTSRLSFNLFGLCYGFTGQETSKLPKQQPSSPNALKPLYLTTVPWLAIQAFGTTPCL